jgi:hypothetical protein
VTETWRICDCAHCENGNANKASVRNAHLRTLLEMPKERLLEIARRAYASGNVLEAATFFEVDEGVVSLALLRWKLVASGEDVPRSCIKIAMRGRTNADDDKASRRAIRTAAKVTRQVEKAKASKERMAKGLFAR